MTAETDPILRTLRRHSIGAFNGSQVACSAPKCRAWMKTDDWHQHVARHVALDLELRTEYAATDTTSVELEQWPDHTSIRASREVAESEFVHDGDDVLLRRVVGDWQEVSRG